ncbi:ABC transporter substrate-binding protein [Sulfitobacter sp. F26169L]|uniref:ABC transporter substrate-binding protein n=1 Tax=Sulfitobacter sp. F26169L TaxID=2996015 RepID=UPI002260EA97|nr:ABC transporter substrate-binding protein [Sulfitobacter sp. F26169L]MCX7568119.1 ABC transporter substrate-binding protein [Sulfitobacter sp. F26169L]
MKLFRIAAASVVATFAATVSFAQDKVTFGTNWLAQAGHGGYYQAVADGTYEKYGLEVDIQMGGPQVNNRPMLPAGKLDFLMGGNMLQAFDSVRNGIPVTVVASIFQKDPQAILAHKGVYKDFADVANAPKIYIGKDAQFSFWKWMTVNHGFKDENLAPYAYNIGPFLVDEKAVQQAFATAEPIYAANEGVETDIFLLADYGWDTYSTTIEARTQMIEENPDLVNRFVEASIIGWYNFMYGDNQPAFDLIKEANPEMTDEKLAKEVEYLKALGIVDSGLALEKGIGAMDPARTAKFLKAMEDSGIVDKGSVDLDLVANYSFVNQGLGMDLRK